MDISAAGDVQNGPGGAAEPREQGAASESSERPHPVPSTIAAGDGSEARASHQGRASPEAPARSLTKRQRIEAALDRNDELLYLIEGSAADQCLSIYASCTNIRDGAPVALSDVPVELPCPCQRH